MKAYSTGYSARIMFMKSHMSIFEKPGHFPVQMQKVKPIFLLSVFSNSDTDNVDMDIVG
jgi:hypothetical protein